MISILGEPQLSEHQCSRANCDSIAVVALLWRNPKIHSEDRKKVWLACDEHKTYLAEFLETRAFPLTILPLEEFLALDRAQEGLL